MLEEIKKIFDDLLEESQVKCQRYLFSQFNVDDRLTGLTGARGVGKTTLLLQFIKNYLPKEKVFYFSADFFYFKDTPLFEFVRDLHQKENYSIIFIDEIHKYPNWNQELKNLYDAYPKLKLVFSGSSMLDLVKGSYDLSRRAIFFHLNGMSFREYLNFKTGQDYPVIDYRDLIENYQEYGESLSVIQNIENHFEEYLQRGYYPFVFENPTTYKQKIDKIISKTIFEDIANLYSLKTPNLQLFTKLLTFLASIPPGEINPHKIAQNLKVDHKTVTHYLSILHDVSLVRFVYPNEGGNQRLRKPEKIFLQNATLLFTLQKYVGKKLDRGNFKRTLFHSSSPRCWH